MTDVVRYRVDEAIRWLDTGATEMRKDAAAAGRSAAHTVAPDLRSVGQSLKKAAASARDYGRGAVADMAHRRAESVEYVLDEERFDIVKGGSIHSIRYDALKTIELKGERARLTLESGDVTIKPVAHLVTSGARVPLGWSRNGLDAPYMTLIEEIAARAGITPVKV